MTDRQSTHGHDCWSWGPKHYECAVREIERLREQLRLAVIDQAIAEAEANDVRRNAGVHVPGSEHKAYAGCTIWRGSLRVSVTETAAIERRIDADEAFFDLVKRALDSLADAWDADALNLED